jgi:hypothetical protein
VEFVFVSIHHPRSEDQGQLKLVYSLQKDEKLFRTAKVYITTLLYELRRVFVDCRGKWVKSNETEFRAEGLATNTPMAVRRDPPRPKRPESS